MNKLFTKIAALVLGMTMAIGVGVAIGTSSKANEARADDSFTIEFKDSGENSDDGTDQGNAPTVSKIVKSNSTTYVKSFSSCTKLYLGKSGYGIKLGSGSAAGTVNFTLADTYKVNIKTIKVVSAKYGSDTGTLSLFNGSTSLKTGITPGTDYTHTFTSPTTVTSVKLTTSEKRAYIKSVVFTVDATPTGTATSSNFSSSKAYVLCGKSGTNNYYLNGTTGSVFNSDVSWGTTTSTESSAYQFTLTGTTSATSATITATTFIDGTTYYLKALTSDKFNLTSTDTTLTVALKSDGTIHNPSTDSRNLRVNTGYGFRWYAGSTGVSAYFIETTPIYTIVYRANSGTGTMTNTRGENPTVANNGFTAPTGYTFAGWNTAEDGTGISYSAGATPKKNLVLYAQWSLSTYEVTANIQNGSFTGSGSATHGTAYSGTITPNDGYLVPASLTSVYINGSATSNYSYSDGSFSVAAQYVTGPITINAECPSASSKECFFDYDLNNCSIVDAPESMFSEQQVQLTITPDEHYKVPAAAVVDNVTYVNVTGSENWNYSNGVITINGADDDLDVYVSCIEKVNATINMGTLTGVSADDGNPASVEEGETVTLTFTANEGYGLPESSGVTVTGAANTSWSQSAGELQITGGTTKTITVSVIGIQRTLQNITLSSNEGNFILGDEFVKPTVTANYNVGPSEDVTNKATATGDGLVNGILTSTGSKTITISYGGKNATYTANVTAITPSYTNKYVKVTSAPTDWSGTYLIVYESSSYVMDGTATTGSGAYKSVTISSSEIASTSTIDTYTYTIAKGTTDTSKYTVKSHSGYYIDRPTSGSGGGLSVSSTIAYELSIVYDTDHTEIRASCYASTGSNKQQVLQWNKNSSGQVFKFYNSTQEDIQLYKYQPQVLPSLKWITAVVKDGTYYQGSTVTSDNFVVTAHYNDGSTSTPTTDITVTNGYLNNVGDNIVTLTYGGKSYDVTVKAVPQTATLTGLSWDQGELTIIDGHGIDFGSLGTITATYDQGPETTKSIDACTVSIYTKVDDTYTKVSDIADGSEITSASHGKYLGVTYTEKTVTLTAYSSAPIYVVETLEDVFVQEETTTWSKVTSINEGDVVTFVGESKSKVASSFNDNDYINSSSYDTTVSTTFTFTVGKVVVGNNTYYTFQNEDGYLGNHSTGTSGDNYAYLDETIDKSTNKNYFTVSFDEGNVVITSVYDTNRVLQLRNSSDADRICFYGSTQTAIQLYKGTPSYEPTGQSIANTDAVQQKAVLDFIADYTATVNAICLQSAGGTTDTAALKAAWNGTSGLTGRFATAAEVGQNFKDLFKYGYSDSESSDPLRKMLASYNWIYAKYGESLELTDFLHVTADRPEAPTLYLPTTTSVFGNIENGNMVAIVVIVSVVSLTAIGGYFFLKKRREQN